MIYLEKVKNGKMIPVSKNVIRIIKRLMQGQELIIFGKDAFFVKGNKNAGSFNYINQALPTIMKLVNERFLHSRYEDRKASALRISILPGVELIAYHSKRITIVNAIDLENGTEKDIDMPGWFAGVN